MSYFYPPGRKVADILKGKKGSIKQAPLPSGAPGRWWMPRPGRYFDGSCTESSLVLAGRFLRTWFIALSAVAIMAVGCESHGPARITPEFLTLSISNQTALNVTVFVNGSSIGVFPAGASEDPINPARLPQPPWDVEARTASGRLLTVLSVRSGDVWRSTADPAGHSTYHGKGTRVDLS